MKLHRQTQLFFTLVIWMLSGCQTVRLGLDPGPAGAGRLGAERPGKAAGDYPVDLTQLIFLAAIDDPDAVAKAKGTYLHEAPPASAASAPIPTRELADLEAARKSFYNKCGDFVRCGVLRDRVQERLIWASESACSDYLTSVRKSFTSTNLNLGGATTLLGALGSVLTSATATRVFSGAAAVTSGVRAEYNDVYFSSQAFELVSKAIRSVRDKTLKGIRDERRGKSAKDYTLEAAVGDAVRFHGTCNVLAGLEEASDAVTRERDPGLRRLSELLQGVGAGVNLSLGTAALDTSDLPSARRTCGQIAATVSAGKQAANDFSQAAKKAQEDPVDSEIKKKYGDREPVINRLAKSLSESEERVKNECDLKGAVNLAETKMFDTMREFAGMQLSEKQVGKAKFDAARAEVMAVKAALELVLVAAQNDLRDITSNAKAP